MKYMLLIYSNPANWEQLTEAERDAQMGEYGALAQEITESGEMVSGDPLGDRATARTVRVRGGVTQASDGPFLEAKEHLAGYFVVDCKDIDRATELAARIPAARTSLVEVWPIMDMGAPDV
jgi:hypothetical protein